MMDFTEAGLKKLKDKNLLNCFLMMGQRNPLAGPAMIKDDRKKFKLLEKVLFARLRERRQLLKEKKWESGRSSE